MPVIRRGQDPYLARSRLNTRAAPALRNRLRHPSRSSSPDATCPLDPRLDRIRQVDLRSLAYPVSAVLEPAHYAKPRSYTWFVDERLDQGQEGACVGFGWAHELAARPAQVAGIGNEFARDQIYRPAQRIDEWPGEDYEGTSVLAGAKVVADLGFIDEYRWCFSLGDLVATLGYLGPVVIGVDWYTGMFDTDAAGFVRPTGHVAGGHCVCLRRVKLVKLDASQNLSWENVDPVRSFVEFINSWGASWGIDGIGRLALVDLAHLWPGGDFCVPLGRDVDGEED